MRKTLRLLTLLFVLLTSVGCDQATKMVAKTALATRPPLILLGGLIELRYDENPGAFLSLGASLPVGVRTALLVLGVAAILVAGMVYILRARGLNTGQVAALSLLISGGVGNLIDRIFHAGAVADFMILAVGPLHTGIFNVADVAIVGGLLLFLASAAWAGRQSAPTVAERT
jgi:signal peptidase II